MAESKRSREVMETRHRIYAIFSNGDNRFSIRNSQSEEDKERSPRALLYLHTHEIEHTSILDAEGLSRSDFSGLENSLGDKKVYTLNVLLNSKYHTLLLLPLKEMKRKVYAWILTWTTHLDMYVVK